MLRLLEELRSRAAEIGQEQDFHERKVAEVSGTDKLHSFTLRSPVHKLTREPYAITGSEMLNIALKLGRGLQARGTDTRHRPASRRLGLSIRPQRRLVSR